MRTPHILESELVGLQRLFTQKLTEHMQMEPRGYVPAPTTPTFQSSKFLSMASTSPSPCCKPIVQGVLALSLKSEADVHERALAAAHANSLFGLLAQWIEDGMKTSPEAIAATLCELYQSRMRRM